MTEELVSQILSTGNIALALAVFAVWVLWNRLTKRDDESRGDAVNYQKSVDAMRAAIDKAINFVGEARRD